MESKITKEDKNATYVVLPAYNEATRIQPVIESIAEKGYNMVIVNDGSSDNTLEVILESKKKYPNNIHLYSLVINRGVGIATQTGFEAVLKFNPKYIVSMDSDGQHSADDLDNVIEPLVSGRAEAVIGVRPLKDMPRTRNFANNIMNILTRIFYGVDVSDSQTGFRALTIDALNQITINARGYLISSEFIREINDNDIPFEEVTIQTIYTPETQAKGTDSKVALKILFENVLIYSIIFPIISLIAILIFFYRYRSGKNSFSSFFIWTIAWIFVIIFSIYPDSSLVFARAFGITRGLDFIIIVALVFIFYLGARLYYKIDNLQDDVNKLVKEVALNNEISLDDEEE